MKQKTLDDSCRNEEVLFLLFGGVFLKFFPVLKALKTKKKRFLRYFLLWRKSSTVVLSFCHLRYSSHLIIRGA